MMRERFLEFYVKQYKKLVIIPIVLVVWALVVIGLHVRETGDIMDKDVSLKGGISATVYTEDAIDVSGLKRALEAAFSGVTVRVLTEFGTARQIGITIEVGETDDAKLRSIVEEATGLVLSDENFSVEIVGSTLGASFYQQMVKALVFGFVLMMIVIFITFRSIVPSVAVVLAALFDIIVTIALIDVAGMRISTAGIAALLLLIGYSVDTDVLLTTRVVKRKEGDIKERVWSAMKTGLTMTATTIAALLVGFVVAESAVFKEMFAIVMLGLVVDVVMTYLMNGPLMLWYAKRKEVGG